MPGLTRTVAVVLSLAPAISLHAQGDDQARLAIGIMIGRVGAASLWSVDAQPIASVTTAPDTFALHRGLGPNLTISGVLAYFPRQHFGWTLEFTHLGLGPHDQCNITADHGDQALVAACDSLARTHESAAVSMVQAGAVVRPLVGHYLQPYLKGLAGVAFTPSSTVNMVSDFGQTPGTFVGTAPLRLTIYDDNEWSSMRPTVQLAGGFTTAPRHGYALHFEARETWLSVAEATGATIGQGYSPPHRYAVRGFTSIVVGFDVVFIRRHGRRY